MATDKQIIAALNDIRATEQRQELMYRRAAELVTGPNRLALVDEFKDHAEDEAKHAAHAMGHIMALGGDLDTNVDSLPVCRNLDDVLSHLKTYEEEGIKKWIKLRDMLGDSDAFKHVVEDILATESDHYDDVRRWQRKDYAVKSINMLKMADWK